MKKLNKILAVILAMVMCLSLLPMAAFAADEVSSNPVADTFEGVNSNFEIWKNDELNDAGNLDSDTDNGNRAVNDVEKIGETAGTLNEGLNAAVEEAVQFEAVVDEDGKPLLDENGSVVTQAVEGTGNLNEFVEGKAGTAAEAAKNAADAITSANEKLSQTAEKIAEGNVADTEELAKEIKDQCAEAEKQYDEAAKACAEANAAVAAAQEKYDSVIAAAKEKLELEDDADVIAVINQQIQAANADLAEAKKTLTKTEAELEALKDITKLVEKYNAIADALKEAKSESGAPLTPAQIQAILLEAGLNMGALKEDANVLEALKGDSETANGNLVNTAIDYAEKFQAVKDAEDALNNISSVEANKLAGAKDILTESETQADMTNITNIESLYDAIDTALTPFINDGNRYERDLANRIKGHLVTVKEYEAKKAAGEETTKEENAAYNEAMEKLFVKDTWALTQYPSLVKQLGSQCSLDGIISDMNKPADNGSDRKKAHDLIEILDHMLRNEEVAKAAQEKFAEETNEAQQALERARENLRNVDLAAALEAYKAEGTKISSKDAAETAIKLAAVLAQMDEENTAELEKAWKAVDVADAFYKSATNRLNYAIKNYKAAQKKVQETQALTELSAAELAELLEKAKEQQAAALKALNEAQAEKDKAEELKKEADKAVEDAQARRDELDRVRDELDQIRDELRDSLAETVEIEDEAVPLAAGPVTRAEFIDYLWRHEGRPESDGVCTFTDVEADHEYILALAWAEQNGIIEADENGNFEPDELVTVAAVRDILDNFARVFEMDVDVYALATLTGEDDEAVLNCDEVIAEFFGEETEEQEAA